MIARHTRHLLREREVPKDAARARPQRSGGLHDAAADEGGSGGRRNGGPP